MKYLGIVSTALALTLFAAAEDTPRNTNAGTDQPVIATAALQKNLDAKKAKQGDPVTVKLTESVQLAGTKLPRNTQLIGHIDTVQPSENKGTSKVVLTFDQAQLPDGKQIAIKSTIVGVYPEGTQLVSPNPLPLDVLQEPSSPHGYSLTSNVADANSGTLTANGKDVRVENGSELQFEVTPAGSFVGSRGK